MTSATELASIDQAKGLAARLLGGEVVVLRRALQQAGLMERIAHASIEGIGAVVGADRARIVAEHGFDRIHETIAPDEIPAVTNAIYARVTAMAHENLQQLIPRVFADAGGYYFEKSPNVRFHIPYDLAAEHRRQFAKFSEQRGDGKITAHGPHRDPWVDCPENAINVWIAIGPVRRGNGLTIFPHEYHTPFAFKDGYINWGVKLNPPLTFALEPGDAVLFHGNHLHGSELNGTDRTRYVISYRVTLGKPYYPHGHYHQYLHGGLATGPFRSLAGVPQNLQWSFLRYQWRRVRKMVLRRGSMSGSDARSDVSSGEPQPVTIADSPIALDDFAVGTIRAVSETACVARVGEEQFAAFGRRCPHMGGDLAGGWIANGKLVCPLHSLSFDVSTGASPCRSVKPLRKFPLVVRDDCVHVEPARGTD